MKLKKVETSGVNDIPEMGDVSADAQMLDLGAPQSAPSSGGVGAMIAFIASLAAAALIGATAAMMYVNWGLIAEA